MQNNYYITETYRRTCMGSTVRARMIDGIIVKYRIIEIDKK